MASSRIQGITIEFGGDTTKLQTALKGLDSKIKSTSSSLKDVNKLLKLDPSNTELLSQKQQMLQTNITDTAKRLETLRDASKKMAATASDYDNFDDRFNSLQREIIATENELEQLKIKAIESQTAFVKMKQIGTTMKEVGDKIASVGTSLTKYVTVPLVGLGTAAVKTAADFDTSMSQVQATMGLTADSTSTLNGEVVNTTDALSQLARQMGAETKFSASEAADAINILAMAGQDAQTIYNTLPSTLNLAAAGGIEIASAADIATGVMAGFGMEAGEAAHVADVLAKTASSAKGSVSDFGAGLSTVAGQASITGQSFEDTATALGILGNNNISASEGGKMLQRVLKNLYQPTSTAQAALDKLGVSAYDAQGNTRPLQDVLQDLQGQLGTLSEADYNSTMGQIFDTASLRGAAALIKGSGDEFDNLREQIGNCAGAAEDMAKVQEDNLMGQLTILKSQLSELAISFGELLMPTIRKVVSGIQGFVDKLNNMDDSTKKTILRVAEVAAVMGPLLVVIGKVTSGVGGAIIQASKVAIEIEKIHQGVGPLAKSISAVTTSTVASTVAVGGLVVGLAALTVAMGVGIGKFVEYMDSSNRLERSLKDIEEAAAGASDAVVFSKIAAGQDAYNDAMTKQSVILDEITDKTKELKEAQAALGDGADPVRSLVDKFNSLKDAVEAGTVSEAEACAQLDTMYAAITGASGAFMGMSDAKAKIDSLALALGDSGDASKASKEAMANLEAEIADLQHEYDAAADGTKRYQRAVMDLVKSGYTSAEEAAKMLGISTDELQRKMVSYEQETQAAQKSTEGLSDEQQAAIETAVAMAAAEEEANNTLGDVASAARQAMESGGDLRAAYEELESQFESAKESGDTLATQEAELALQALNLAATNQELSTVYAELGVAVGDSTVAMAQYLVDAGISADDFASGVTSMRDSVVNSFKSISSESATTIDEIGTALTENLAVQQQWSADLVTLWNSTEDATVRAYINYIREKGPEYASAVAEYANGGTAQLAADAATWAAIGEQSANDYAAAAYANAWVAAQAGDANAQAAIDAMMNGDYSSAGEWAGEEYASGAESTAGGAQSSGQAVGEAFSLGAEAGFGTADTAAMGAELVSGVASAITANTPEVTTASTQLATSAVKGFDSQKRSFTLSGITAALAIQTGIQSRSAAIVSLVRSIAANAAGAFSAMSGSFQTAGATASNSLASGISSGSGTVSSAATAVARAAQSAANISGWEDTGYYMMQGLARGIYSGSSLVTSAAKSVAQEALKSAKQSLGIASPSKVFRDEVGAWIPPGIAEGIKRAMPGLDRTMASMSDSLAGAVALPSLTTPNAMAAIQGDRNNSTTNNYGNVTVNVYAHEGESAADIARAVEQRVYNKINSKGAVWA